MKRKPPTAPAITPANSFDDDSRSAHQLSATENADLCAGCIKCCSYITVEIDSPRSAEDYDQWIWALYHEHISLFVEKPEKWYLQVDTRCGKLNTDGRCSIYGEHPVLCRLYDPRSCERRLPLLDIDRTFDSGEEFEAWIREKRPGHYRNLLRFRAKHPIGGAPTPQRTNGLVHITSVAPAANGRVGEAGRNGVARASASAAPRRTRAKVRAR